MRRRLEGGKFISIEGGEGAGKSALLQALAAALEEAGYSVVSTFEPGASPLGEEIRSWLLDRSRGVSISAKAELLLFLADRAEHLERLIEPALRCGQIVLCDRFNDSTVAYQGAARSLGISFVERLCEAVSGSLSPDLTLLLDLDPEIGLKRAGQVRKRDRIESEQLEFHQKLREGFLSLAERHPERIRIIDAARPLEAVLQDSLRELSTLCPSLP